MRRIAAAVGVALAGLGLAMVLGVPVSPFSMQSLFVTLVGVLAGVQGLRYAGERRAVEPAATRTGDPERRSHVPVPGDDLDSGLALPRDLRDGSSYRRREVVGRLREIAVETMVARDVCAREEAESRVAEGTWTDDPIASWFLAEDAEQLPLSTRLRFFVRRESAYAHGVYRTVDEIVALQEAPP